MNYFQYKDGILHAENVSLADLAAEVGTPFYCYSVATIVRHYNVFRDAVKRLDAKICYSAKANSNPAVLQIIAKLGAGCDVVSGAELLLALNAGFDPKHIVFSGIGKTENELRSAVQSNVGQINIESESELKLLSKVASELRQSTTIAVRVNPDVSADTHEKISTGRKEDKFGIPIGKAQNIYTLAQNLPAVIPTGVAVHIGSQITDLAPFREAFTRVREFVELLRKDGFDIQTLDLGGGLGVPYNQAHDIIATPDAYGTMAQEVLGTLECRTIFEPGRLIVGNAGVLVTRVIHTKHTTDRKFVIVDAGMNDMIRPAMYNAHHDVISLIEPNAKDVLETVEVVGPVCETGDRFLKDCELPSPERDHLLVLTTAGAYGAVMSSTYNARPLIPEILVNDDQFAVVRRRQTFEEMTALTQLPDWLD